MDDMQSQPIAPAELEAISQLVQKLGMAVEQMKSGAPAEPLDGMEPDGDEPPVMDEGMEPPAEKSPYMDDFSKLMQGSKPEPKESAMFVTSAAKPPMKPEPKMPFKKK